MIPIFVSEYSGKSLLTFYTPEEAKKYNKQSVIQLCLDNSIERPFVVDTAMTGTMEMQQNFSKAGLKPRFGWKCNFSHENSEEGQENKHKIIIFSKNTKGYKDLIKLHNYVKIKNDSLVTPEVLKSLWTDDLQLVIPFYDSYIFNNTLYGKKCQPEFSGVKHLFFEEQNNLPFDSMISSFLPEERILTKSVLYEKRDDFKTWLTYRCSLNLLVKGKARSLDCPNFDHCHSKEFSFESYTDYVKKQIPR